MSNGAALTYDPLGRLYQVTLGTSTTRFLYDGDALVEEYNGAGTLLRRHAHWEGEDVPVATFDVSGGTGLGTLRYLFADQQGSIVAEANGSGAVTHINTYDEQGIPAATNVGTFQYTGQAYLPQLGLYYYRARMYSPTLGRFMQTDPIGYEGGMNLYAYVLNDPVNFNDPSGLTGVDRPIPNCTDYCPITVTALLGAPGGSGGHGGGLGSVSEAIDEPPIVVTGRRLRRGIVAAGISVAQSSCVGQRYANFFATNFDPASDVADAHQADVALLLGLSAHESTWGTSSMATRQNNPFGATPHGDATGGNSYRSVSDAWQSWNSDWGVRINGVGGDAALFADRLLQDNQHRIGAVDRRGPYNTQVAPQGDPLWRPKVINAITSVRRRLSRWQRSGC